MRFHDVFDNAQAKPRPSRGARTALIDPVEALKDSRLVFGRDANARVFHPKHGPFWRGFQRHHDSAFLGVFHRVFDEIQHHLLDLRAVHGKAKVRGAFIVKREPFGCRLFGDIVHRRHDDLGEIVGSFIHGVAFGGGEGQKVVGDEDQAIHFLDDAVQVLPSERAEVILVPLGERFCHRTDVGHGGAELVADVRDKISPDALQSAKVGDFVDAEENPVLFIRVRPRVREPDPLFWVAEDDFCMGVLLALGGFPDHALQIVAERDGEDGSPPGVGKTEQLLGLSVRVFHHAFSRAQEDGDLEILGKGIDHFSVLLELGFVEFGEFSGGYEFPFRDLRPSEHQASPQKRAERGEKHASMENGAIRAAVGRKNPAKDKDSREHGAEVSSDPPETGSEFLIWNLVHGSNPTRTRRVRFTHEAR